MSKLGELFSDDYNFETLAVPAMVIGIPIMVVLALFGLSISWLVGFAVLGVQIILFPLWLMVSWIRDQGKELEAKYFPDVLPTHSSLRLTGKNDYDLITRRRRLEAVSGVKLASAFEERNNRADADAKIRDAIAIAREKMRDPVEFKLLRRELKSYGFWRNMAASRVLGITSTAACVIIASVMLLLSDSRKLSVAALACSGVMFIYWFMIVNQKKMQLSAENYKKQFFNSLATLVK